MQTQATTSPARKLTAPEKRLHSLSNQVKNHLLLVGCKLLSDSERDPFNDWQVMLVTDAGKLSISCRITPFEHGYKTDTIMIHGRFEHPELFPPMFCECNHINRHSGKWNQYLTDGKPQELTDLLRYFSSIIPIMNIE